MDDPKLPCQGPNMDDWFITKSGTEDHREPLELDEVEAAEVARICEMEAVIQGMTPEQLAERTALALAERLKEKLDETLLRRRRAAEACATCPLRAPCLEQALKNEEQHGIWGGLYEEQLRYLYRKRRTTWRAYT